MKGGTKIIVAGAAGRMGQTILKLALDDPDIEVCGAFERAEHAAVGRDVGELLGRDPVRVAIHPDYRECKNLKAVLIDFTHPSATQQNVKLAAKEAKGMVIGTTGLSDSFVKELQKLSGEIPIVQAPNMSLGVNILFRLSQLCAQALDPSYDVEIVETHHRHKKDAPSGTAKRLAEILAAARRQAASAIPVHALRAGDIVGDHTVILAGSAERLELTHRAHGREVFAQGALKAAQFIVRQNPGLYDMSHVLTATLS